MIDEKIIKRARSMAERGTVGKIGDYITIRVSSKVVMKDEVYLGYLLLNKYLGRLFERVIERKFEGFRIYSDLENFYYLCPYSEQLRKLPEYAKKQFRTDLPLILFCDEEDTDNLEVLGYFKNLIALGQFNWDVFPLYMMPKEYKQDLKHKLKTILNDLREKEDFPNFIGCLSYFFSALTTPPFGKEMQSPAWFLLRFYYDRIKNENKKEKLKRILQHCGLTKSEIENMPHDVGRLMTKLKGELKRLSKGAMNSMMNFFLDDVWDQLGFPHQGWKFTELSNFDDVIDSCMIVSPYFVIAKSYVGKECSICGFGRPTISDTNIMFGVGKERYCKLWEKGVTKIKGKKHHRLACIKCGLASYLKLKLIGCMWTRVGGGKRNPLPRRFMVILHIGQHSEKDVDYLSKMFVAIHERVREFHDKVGKLRELREVVEKLTRKIGEYKNLKRLRELKEEKEKLEVKAKKLGDDVRVLRMWVVENVPLILRERERGWREIERRCIPFYIGKEYGIYAFLLPKAPSGIVEGKDLEFYQKRFDESRVVILSTIGYLSKMCKCDGDYYYMCLPTTMSMRRTIHIPGYECSVDKAINYYAVLVNLVSDLYGAREGLDRKFLLAERYAKDPIIEFTHFLREWKQKKRYYNLKQDFKYDFNAIKGLLGED